MVSMHRALTVTGAVVSVVTDGDYDLSTFDGAVLPGVGATGPAMATLNRTGLSGQIQDLERPLLAVCVGMQVLFEFSEEDRTPGLGLLDGTVTRLRTTPLPHMGWNDVTFEKDSILGDRTRSTPFYFVHSFAVTDTAHRDVIGTTTYGDQTFVSAVRRNHIVGLQFHPERSSDAGLDVIRSFVSSTRLARRVA
jgi:glutamine amidotransferase